MQIRNTALMAVVLLALSAFVYFYEIRGGAERDAAERRDALLLQFDTEAVTGLRVITADGSVRATRDDEGWTIVEPIQAPADSGAFDSLVDQLHSASHERVIVEEAEDLAPFGLDAPRVEVTVERGESAPLTLKVGKDTPVGANLYVMAAASGSVYSAPQSLGTATEKTLFDLRDKTVLDTGGRPVRALDLQHDGLTATLRRGDDDAWQAEAPFAGPADGETIDDLVGAVTDAEASAFVHDGELDEATLASFGLDRPVTTLAIRTEDDASYGLRIGAASEEPAGRFAMRDGGTSVFVVDADLLDALPDDELTLRDKQVLDLDRPRVAEITIAAGDTDPITLSRRGADWAITAPHQIDADASAVSRLISALQDLRADGFGGATGPSTASVRVGFRDAGADDQPAAGFVDIAIGDNREIVPLSRRNDEDPLPVEVTAVTVGDADESFLVPSHALDEVLVDLFDLRAKTLVEFSQDDLTSMQITAPDGATHMLQRSGETWTLEEGDLGTSDPGDLLWDLNYLRMQGVATEWDGAAPDLAAYGLDAPRFRITASTTEGVVADVSIGAEAPTGESSARVYARIGEQPAVFEIGSALAEAIAGFLDGIDA